MNIAYTMSSARGDTDLVLESLAKSLIAKGLRVCGIVQINTQNQDCGHRCDMDVQVLPDGPVIRISQSLGRESKGCRLDTAALEQAVGEVTGRLGQGADVFILNKFGKHEADGRGFRDLIAQALSQDIPVITGVNKQNLETFLEFSGGYASPVSSDVATLSDWLDNTVRQPISA